jgi:hypothetical protein
MGVWPLPSLSEISRKRKRNPRSRSHRKDTQYSAVASSFDCSYASVSPFIAIREVLSLAASVIHCVLQA